MIFHMRAMMIKIYYFIFKNKLFDTNILIKK